MRSFCNLFLLKLSALSGKPASRQVSAQSPSFVREEVKSANITVSLVFTISILL
jgi:hypothetical protein